jgi:hypothetical protein
LFLKLYILQNLLSCKACKIVTFQAKFNKINIYFPIICFKLLMLYQLVNDLFAIKLSSDFYIVQISTNYEKIYSNSLSLPLLLLDGHRFVRCRGNNSYAKDIQTYNFRIRSGMCIKVYYTIQCMCLENCMLKTPYSSF